MEVNSAEFRSVELFTALTEMQREEVALGATLARRESGEYVFRAGDTADFLFIVSEGRVGIYADAHDGVLHPVSIVSRGQALGINSLFPVASWDMTARCLTRTVLIVIPRRWLLSHMIGDADLELRILQGVMEIERRRVADLVATITSMNSPLSDTLSGLDSPLFDRVEPRAPWQGVENRPPPTGGAR